MKTINKDYAYNVDEHQFILYKTHIVEDSDNLKDKSRIGTVVYGRPRYFPTLNLLVRELIDVTTLSEHEDMVRLNTKINDIKRWVDKELFKSVKELNTER